MVAGSSPAGATKFSDENHEVKPLFSGGFFVFIIYHWQQNGSRFFCIATLCYHRLLHKTALLHVIPT
ncbi:MULTISPECIES: hypothetical protein, partial [Lonsdalea]|uniref:hypothetical protein n=1 Tax=Lonsdalea TaxID=1082702 RepID=UPI001C658331